MKMPLERFEPKKKRLKIIEASKSPEMTGIKETQDTTGRAGEVEENFSHFTDKGFSFLDEISHVEAQRWVNLIEDKGFREATVKFMYSDGQGLQLFIETSGELEGKNPSVVFPSPGRGPGPGPSPPMKRYEESFCKAS